MNSRPRLVYVVTHPVTADVFLRGQLTFMRENGFDVTVVASPGPELERARDREGVATVGIPMSRRIWHRDDAAALGRLTQVFRQLRPDIVHASTPKAALLGLAAARLTRVPLRIYLMRGLRLETTRGVLRGALGVAERVTAAAAHHVACVSPSLLDVVTTGGWIPREKASVVGAGTSNGVDVVRYHRTPAHVAEGKRRMQALGLDTNDPVVGFVGRLAVDKGALELLDAFERVRRVLPRARLLVIGGDLGAESQDPRIVERLRATPNIVDVGTIADVAPYYTQMDVLAFPSHREGFPNVPLEAAAMEIPVVGARTTGVVDAIVNGETGALVAPRDPEALAARLLEYLADPERAANHGRAGRLRTARLFENRNVWAAWLAFFRDKLALARSP